VRIRGPNLNTFNRFKHRITRNIHGFQMFRSGMRVAVGASGGKDSTLLLYTLVRIREDMDGKLDLKAFRVIDPDSPCVQSAGLSEFVQWCKSLNVPFERIKPGVPDDAKGKEISACFRCAFRRREALFKASYSQGYRVLALGHTAFDLAVTALMNLVYHAELETMPPVMDFFDDKIRLIRPMFNIAEETVKRISRKLELPVPPPSCHRLVGQTRHRMEERVRELTRENRHAVPNILKAAKYFQDYS